MECKTCSAVLPENANFCPACGEPTQSLTPQIGIFPESDSRTERPLVEEAVPVSEELFPIDAEESIYEEPAPEETEVQQNIPEKPDAYPEQPAIPESGSRKPRRKRPVLIPVLLMVFMLTLGTVCFFLIPSADSEAPDATDPVIGNQETTGLPQSPENEDNSPAGGEESNRSEEFIPADERFFVLQEDGLHFLPQKYTGGPILVIPNEIGGKPVTAIAESGFADCVGITTIILPDTLKTIGAYAFAGNRELRGIWLPDSMESVGEGAFMNCIGLESVAVQSGMRSIGQNAFTGCARLLYFFYDGNYADWLELYNEYVTPYTSVTCLDGDYYHGVQMP